MKKWEISQETLKLIACVTMLIDHIGAVFFDGIGFRIVGRLAFPIYCFLLAEGIHYTGNEKKYGLRLLAGAMLAEIPFDLLFYGGFTWQHQNVMVTLLMGLVYGTLQKPVRRIGHRIILVLPFIALAEFLNVDYGGWGVAMVGFFLLTRDLTDRWISQLIGLAMICWMIGGSVISLGFLEIPIQLFGLCALIPIGCYKGRKRTDNVWVQRFFYLFYPVHLALLLLVRGML